jgi:hypothetical protein
MSAEVNVFETLATGKAVSSVTFRFAAMSARPAAPCQTEPSANRIDAEIPGIPYFARMRSRRASRAARNRGVALADPWRGDGVAVTGPAGRGFVPGVRVAVGPLLPDAAGSAGVVGDPRATDGSGDVGRGLGPTPAMA